MRPFDLVGSNLRGHANRLRPMFSYSKLAQGGIAAVSYLAGIASDSRLAGSLEIAESRQISRVLIAKILTKLSAGGLVEGKPGPTGGYRLTRPPVDISLLDVVRIFDNLDERVMCPFGPHWCEHGPICPLHDFFNNTHKKMIEQLAEQNFAQFVQ